MLMYVYIQVRCGCMASLGNILMNKFQCYMSGRYMAILRDLILVARMISRWSKAKDRKAVHVRNVKLRAAIMPPADSYGLLW
jgi:hypothetical protein